LSAYQFNNATGHLWPRAFFVRGAKYLFIHGKAFLGGDTGMAFAATAVFWHEY
jgi:hypothetical protein